MAVTESPYPVALVTGGARGIGRAICARLAQDGYAVAINYAHSQVAAEDLQQQLGDTAGVAWAVQADISQPAEANRLVDDILARWGRIDLLVNNAGITSQGRADLLEATEASWDAVFNTNLRGPFFLTQRVCREMIRARAEAREPQIHPVPRGTVINISSISAYAVSTNRADYCLTKAALAMMTKLFATRMADHDVFVYEISPGVIQSDMTAAVRDKYDQLISEGLTPLQRWGQPADIAQAVSVLAAHALPFCTGQCLHIDGGFHIRRL